MKAHRRFKKTAAFVLASAMVLTTPAIPTQAAEPGIRNVVTTASFWTSITNFFNNLFGGGRSESKAEETGTNEGTELELVSDETTVSDATELRASTYRVADNRAQSVVYFPVTMFNYDKNTINNLILTEEAEAAATSGQYEVDYWKGLYFSGGNPTDTTSASNQLPLSKEVQLDETQIVYKGVEVEYNWRGDYSAYTRGSHYLDRQGENVVTDISCTYNWLNRNYTWTVNNQTQASHTSTITLYYAEQSDTVTVTSGGYAGYDYWTGNGNAGNNPDTGVTTSNSTRGYLYSGLVEDELDANGNIQITVPDGGIFDVNDTTSKDVYTNVGLPFEYDSDTGYYTFDSDEMAAYFSGNPSSGVNLAYSEYPAAFHWQNDGSYNTGFFPFNTLSDDLVQAVKGNVKADDAETRVQAYPVTGNRSDGSAVSGSGDDAADFWFGMTANVSFTMNPNGKITASDDSADAEFTFSGDDDVWVFVDGKLVLDLGGIHDSVSGSFNFADNTITMWSTNDNYSSGDVAGNHGSGNGEVSQGQLFNVLNDDGTVASTGKLNTDINTFCATDEHTLTIYYLERGGGLSNNRIEFNLPQRDSLSVSKVVSSTDSEGIALTQEQQNTVNSQEFTYTLYDGNDEVMANQAYSLYSSSGTFLGNGSTNRYGQFTIWNGQTARFYGLTFTNENTYYVVEGSISGYETPAWNVQVTGNEGYGHVEENDYTSDKITISGDNEATETVTFTCTNTLTHVNGTTVTPQNDRIVIDYGLPVEIDVLANDLVTGGTLSLEEVEGAKYGSVEIVDNKIVYTLSEQLTDVETLTYTVKANAELEADNKTATATVKIIPATTMYYEEDFGELVTYTKGSKSSEWETVTGTAQTDYQEPGVVGTPGDSPYGSDVAYLNNSGDSYGTSKHVNTTNGAAQFSYTFTGTGTTVFARMTENTGYLQIKLSKDGEPIRTTYRDTKILKNENIDTLYNVPVYDVENLEYGTYTLQITIAKAGTKTGTVEGAGSDFYVDGIRIYQPMDMSSDESETAEDAYSRDFESNVKIAQVREKLLAEYTTDGEDGLEWNTENGFVTFTDSNGEMQTAQEYSSIGPKNETYLNDGQSISFSLANWDSNEGYVYLGIKAPTGSGQVTIGTTTLNINNTVDCYYDIRTLGTVREVDGQQVVTFNITAGADSLISVTNIKVTGITDPDFVIVNGDNVDANEDVNVAEESVPAEEEITEDAADANQSVSDPSMDIVSSAEGIPSEDSTPASGSENTDSGALEQSFAQNDVEAENSADAVQKGEIE